LVRKNITVKEIAAGEEADLVVDYIINRKKKGLYTLALVSGLPGTGKTSTCFRLGELITKKVLGENQMKASNVVDSFLDLTKAVMNSKPEELNIFVVEEVSVLFPSRRAMAGVNVDLARLLDTARKKQVILLANAPIWSSIDSHMRALGNIYIETKKIYRMEKIVVSKFFRLQTNPRTGKTYTHSFMRDGRTVKRMHTKMPNEEQWQLYEHRKDDFMEKLYSSLVHREQKRIDKENKNNPTIMIATEPLTNKEKEFLFLFKDKKLTQKEIAKKWGCTQSNISQFWSNLKKKMLKHKENEEK